MLIKSLRSDKCEEFKSIKKKIKFFISKYVAQEPFDFSTFELRKLVDDRSK